MSRTIFVALVGIFALTHAAQAADPLEGRWKTESGETAQIGPCAAGLCITLRTGKHAGKQIGNLKAEGSGYTGRIVDPNDDKSYAGKASLAGSALTLSGCVLGGIICKNQNWTRL